MKRSLILILFAASGISYAWSQSISLDSCIEWAYQSQKFADQTSLIRQSQVLAMESTGKMNLPTLILEGSATYQNENITIQTPPVPGFESPNVPLNFNRLLINFNQTVYNGRMTAHQKLIDSLNYDAKTYQVEVDKAKLKSQVTSLYSSIILVREQYKIIGRQLNTLQAQAKQLQGAVDAGVAFKADITSLKAEMLNLEQNAIDIEYLERSLRQQLATLTEHEISPTSTLELPNVIIEDTGVEARPELNLIESQKRSLVAKSSLISASRMPYVGVFGNLGLGYPGYDIFKSEPSPMLLVGLKLNWLILDWQKSKNDKQLITWNQDILSYQYDRVKTQFEMELVKQKQEINKYEELITRDKQIVDMRREVTQDMSSRLSGGTATTTDFITLLNKEATAELNESIHIIQLALAKISYAIIQGK